MTPPNRFLVVVRAGDTSLHPHWTQDRSARDWDLIVNYFGDDPDRFRNTGDERIDGKGLKWPGLHALLTTDARWRAYDYIWFPDDDLAIGQMAVSRLFAMAARLNLLLAQPALSWQSFHSHAVTLRHPGFRARMTDFVEIMAPCFARSFLATCLPTFTASHSGWGLDWLWPRLAPPGPPRCAVLDDVEMTHTRAIGGPTYAKLRTLGIDPHAEIAALMQRFDLPPVARPRVLAAIDADGRVLDGDRAGDASVLRQLIARDRAAYRAAHRR